MDKTKVDVILVSDIHLGSETSHAKELRSMLETYEFKKLILLGDVFQDINMSRLHRAHWKVLSFLRKMTDPENNIDVIWIEGNHDWKVLNIVGALVGIDIHDEYIWESNGKKFLAIHGHQFDLSLPKSEFLNAVGQNIYLFLQKHFHYKFTRYISKVSNKFSRSVENVREGAIEYAKSKNCDYVFCGHTHHAEHFENYFNTGTWSDNITPTYITITNGEITLHEYRPNDNNTNEK